MKHLKRFEAYSINESRIYGVEILPEDALKQLEYDYVDYKDPENKIEVFPDPRVDGTYAVRVYRKSDNFTFDLLWNRGAYDELEGFTTWPPTSGDLKFFL
jgi:outer membrane cobalamin receptor